MTFVVKQHFWEADNVIKIYKYIKIKYRFRIKWNFVSFGTRQMASVMAFFMYYVSFSTPFFNLNTLLFRVRCIVYIKCVSYVH